MVNSSFCIVILIFMTMILSPSFIQKIMLQWWSEFYSTIATESASYKSIIWNNCNIHVRINGTPIYYHSYVKAGVIFVSDVMFSLSNIESFSIAKQNGLIGSNYLTWSGVRCSVPKQLRNLHVNGTS